MKHQQLIIPTLEKFLHPETQTKAKNHEIAEKQQIKEIEPKN
jgi:hypothetical protein